MNISIRIGARGLFKIEAFKADACGVEVPGSRRVAADWFPNLITDTGLNRLGASATQLAACRVGSGSTVPDFTDTTLVSQVAATSTISSSVSGAQSVAPYFSWTRKTYRFATGVAAGNLSEIGIGWTSTSNLFSRALILDSGGLPTTISVGADETLDVVYELRTYPPSVDSSGTVNISGIDYDWVARAAQVSTPGFWTPGSSLGAIISHSSATAYAGAIGSVTGTPTGSQSSLSVSRAGYANDKKSQCTVTANLAQGNLDGGIRSLLCVGTGDYRSSYQIEFDPPIPKDGTNELSLTYEISWDRQS